MRLSWNLGYMMRSSAQSISLAVLQRGAELELAAVDETGVLHWSRTEFLDNRLTEVATAPAAEPYRAAAIVRAGLVAGVTDRRIDWLRATGYRLIARTQTALVGRGNIIATSGNPEEAIVAVFSSPPTAELLIVRKDSTIERIQVPAG
jgi:hypothetical protein